MPLIDVHLPVGAMPASAFAELAGDPELAGHTWVVLTAATEGGWGVAGFALGADEFAARRGG